MKNNLKELRTKHRLTQLKVQMDTGIEQSVLSKYENENRMPPADVLVTLSNYYGVSIDYILCQSKTPDRLP